MDKRLFLLVKNSNVNRNINRILKMAKICGMIGKDKEIEIFILNNRSLIILGGISKIKTKITKIIKKINPYHQTPNKRNNLIGFKKFSNKN